MIQGQPLFEKFIIYLNECQVRYLIVGGLAVVIHGYNRHTGDVDLWVENSPENISALREVLLKMGYDEQDVNSASKVYSSGAKLTVFLDDDSEIPVEFMPLYSTYVTFEQAWERRKHHPYGDVFVNVVDIDTLIDMKIRAGREQDFRDVLELKKKNNIE